MSHASIILVVCMVLLNLSGCTFHENVRSEQGQEEAVQDLDRAAQTVELRAAEVAGLEDAASGRAPRDLGRAKAILDEMIYFRDQRNPGEVVRLDGVMDGILESIRRAVDAQDQTPDEKADQLGKENRTLKSQVSGLESRVVSLERDLEIRQEICDTQAGLLANRLEIALKGRDDAVREVVRTRSRIEGMASEAEASAMFAEARVLVDRMEEDAFNDRALEELREARRYLDSGKKELDDGNSGGAAYLFDLVSSLYEGFKVSSPRKVTVVAGSCPLFGAPSGSSKRIGRLAQGEVVTGLEAAGNWIRISTTSGLKGWIRKDQVH